MVTGSLGPCHRVSEGQFWDQSSEWRFLSSIWAWSRRAGRAGCRRGGEERAGASSWGGTRRSLNGSRASRCIGIHGSTRSCGRSPSTIAGTLAS